MRPLYSLPTPTTLQDSPPTPSELLSPGVGCPPTSRGDGPQLDYQRSRCQHRFGGAFRARSWRKQAVVQQRPLPRISALGLDTHTPPPQDLSNTARQHHTLQRRMGPNLSSGARSWRHKPNGKSLGGELSCQEGTSRSREGSLPHAESLLPAPSHGQLSHAAAQGARALDTAGAMGRQQNFSAGTMQQDPQGLERGDGVGLHGPGRRRG